MISNHHHSHFDTGTAEPSLIIPASVRMVPYRRVVSAVSRVQRSQGQEAEQLLHSWLRGGQSLSQWRGTDFHTEPRAPSQTSKTRQLISKAPASTSWPFSKEGVGKTSEKRYKCHVQATALDSSLRTERLLHGGRNMLGWERTVPPSTRKTGEEDKQNPSRD